MVQSCTYTIPELCPLLCRLTHAVGKGLVLRSYPSIMVYSLAGLYSLTQDTFAGVADAETEYAPICALIINPS
jgi:hypothetical protein